MPLSFPIGDNSVRDRYAHEGLRYMPHILSLIDQNPLSVTYGCGDRPYWLYKAIDYPCGMYGEFALPLAQAYSYQIPGNPYLGQQKIRELSLAVMRFAARSGHADGSTDDFYPYERALGATGFTLYAMAEAVQILQISDPDILEFLERRALWLARSEETGLLSNHHALRLLALTLVSQVVGNKSLRADIERHRDRLLSWQSEEGWFPEYGGFDLGYHSFTITFLAQLRAATGDDVLTEPLRRAVDLCADLFGADGSFGGETGSRNSYHVLPHGLELLAHEFPSARYAADRFLDAIHSGNRSYLEDNRTFCHYQYNFLNAWRDFADRAGAAPWQPEDGVRDYPGGGIARVRQGDLHTLVSYQKGGVVKATKPHGPVASDTGICCRDTAGVVMAPARDGAVSVDISQPAADVTRIVVKTNFARVPNTLMANPVRFLIFRMLNLTLGRFWPNVLRALLQRLLIKPKDRLPFDVERTIDIGRDKIAISDHIRRRDSGIKLEKIMSSTDLTTLYTASSNPWQASRLFAWLDHSGRAPEFERQGEIRLERTWDCADKSA